VRLQTAAAILIAVGLALLLSPLPQPRPKAETAFYAVCPAGVSVQGAERSWVFGSVAVYKLASPRAPAGCRVAERAVKPAASVALNPSSGPPRPLSTFYPSRFTGAGARVAVVDTGVDYTHPDLRHAVRVLASFVVRTGRGAPLVWIVGVNGTLEGARSFDDYVYSSVGAYAWLDENGHGTHVCGIIAGSGAASGGLYRGVAPNAELWVVKAFSKDGTATLDAILDALYWLLDKPVDIVNLSFAVQGESSGDADPVVAAAEQLAKAGKIVVAAAGNDGPAPFTVAAPAVSPLVVAVAAVDGEGRPALFSGVGGWGSPVKPDVAALGVGVVAPAPTYPTRLTPYLLPWNRYYAALDGTSMATAAASGVLALWVEAVGREAVAANLQDFLRRRSVPTSPFLLPKTFVNGYGLLVPP
jgi:serine protease AprX